MPFGEIEKCFPVGGDGSVAATVIVEREIAIRNRRVERGQRADAQVALAKQAINGPSGDHRQELAEYQKAIALGLDDWQLFLNLGLLYLEGGQTQDATRVLRLAALLGPDRPETHFNLALAYERRGALAQAEQEALLSLQIDPSQPDARNTLGAIYAEEGKYVRASQEWNELVGEIPDYTPARTNLKILNHVESRAPQGGAEPSSFIRVP